MTDVVFVGPTLPIDAASAIFPDARYLPPAAGGDVRAVLDSGVSAIGIVDGFFHDKPAVFHKEILEALHRGIPVFGAASMGALRAAELEAYGMVGVGFVFEQFRDGLLEDDDEVAVAHASAEWDYRPLSDAMVNIRHGLADAVHDGALTEAESSALLSEAKSLSYADRTWLGVVMAAGALGVPADRLAMLRRQRPPDIKARDAALMLRTMRDAAGRGVRAASNDFRPTSYYRRIAVQADHAARYGGLPSDEPPLPGISAWATLFSDPDGRLARDALLYYLAGEFVDRLAWAPSRAAVAQWLQQHGRQANPANCALARAELCLPRIRGMLDGPELNSLLPIALAREGSLEQTQDEVRARWERLARAGQRPGALVDSTIDRAALRRWYLDHIGAEDVPEAELLARSGLSSDAFFEAVMTEYLSDG